MALRLRVVVLLLVSFGAGPLLLDGCLVGCHPDATVATARTGHCHAVPAAEPMARLKPIAHCCRDVTTDFARTNEGRSQIGAASFVPITAGEFEAAAPIHSIPIAWVPLMQAFAFQSAAVPLRL